MGERPAKRPRRSRFARRQCVRGPVQGWGGSRLGHDGLWPWSGCCNPAGCSRGAAEIARHRSQMRTTSRRTRMHNTREICKNVYLTLSLLKPSLVATIKDEVVSCAHNGLFHSSDDGNCICLICFLNSLCFRIGPSRDCSRSQNCSTCWQHGNINGGNLMSGFGYVSVLFVGEGPLKVELKKFEKIKLFLLLRLLCELYFSI